MDHKLVLSNLGHTWILDLDGTIVKHNGYKTDGYDTLLAGAKDFLDTIPEKDMIVIITSRKEDVKEETERFLTENEIRFDHIIFNAPYGERILMNDNKPGGLKTSYALDTERDIWYNPTVEIDETL